MASKEYQREWRKRNPEKGAEYYSRPGQKELSSSHTRNWRRLNPAKTLLTKMRARARQYGRECSITEEQFLALFEPMRCAVTSMPLCWTEGPRGPWAPSVDRIDSSLGYTPQNTRVVSVMYNLAKSEWTDEHVMEMARWLVTREK